MRYYRYFKRLHMEATKGFQTDLSEKEVADLLGEMMSYNELTMLYEWARKMRFDKKKEADKRTYRLTKPRKKKKSGMSKEERQARNAKLLAGLNKRHSRLDMSTEDKLNAFVNNQDTTKKEVLELCLALMGIEETTLESTTTMVTMALGASDFNYYQWAMEQYLQIKSELIRHDLIKGFQDSDANFGMST